MVSRIYDIEYNHTMIIHVTDLLGTRLGLSASIGKATTRYKWWLGPVLLFQICIIDTPMAPKYREMQTNDDLQPVFGLVASTVERSQLEK